MLCRDARPLLHEYSESLLGWDVSERVAEHLASCLECGQELDELERATAALSDFAAHRTSATGAPDLWASFSQKLAERISCEAAAELLPAYRDGFAGAADGVALRAHLEGCTPCAREAAVLDVALESMDRVARSIPAVDLWPAFALRLEQEEARRARWAFWPAVARLSNLFSAPAGRLAFGLGAVALLAVALRVPTWSTSAPSSAPILTAKATPVAPPLHEASVPAHSTGSVETEPRRPVARERFLPVRRVRSRGGERAWKFASLRAPKRERGVVAEERRGLLTAQEVMASLPPRVENGNGVTGSGNGGEFHLANAQTGETPPILLLNATPVMMNPSDEAGGRAVVADVVRAFEQLAQVEDASSQPFGVKPNGQ